MTTERDLESIKFAIEKLQRDKMRQEVAVEEATRKQAKALEALAKDFGVSSVAEAQEVKAKLELDLEEALKTAQEALDKSYE